MTGEPRRLALESVLRSAGRSSPRAPRSRARALANLFVQLYDDSALGAEVNTGLLNRLRHIALELACQKAFIRLAGAVNEEPIVANVNTGTRSETL